MLAYEDVQIQHFIFSAGRGYFRAAWKRQERVCSLPGQADKFPSRFLWAEWKKKSRSLTVLVSDTFDLLQINVDAQQIDGRRRVDHEYYIRTSFDTRKNRLSTFLPCGWDQPHKCNPTATITITHSGKCPLCKFIRWPNRWPFSTRISTGKVNTLEE